MIIKGYQIDFRIFDSFSLKDKRMVVKSLKERLKKRFNVSIAEVAHQDLLNLASLGIAMVSLEEQSINDHLQNILNFIEENYAVEVTQVIEY